MVGVLGFAGNTACGRTHLSTAAAAGPRDRHPDRDRHARCRGGLTVRRSARRRPRRARRAVSCRTRAPARRRRCGTANAGARQLGDAERVPQGEGRQARAAGGPRLQGAQHRAAGAARLVAGAGSERARRVRGARRPGRRRRHLHLQRRARRLQAGRRQLRSQGGHHPRLHRFPTAARLAHHQRLAGRLRWHAVGDDRGHLPGQQHDAQHVTPAHHRDRGPRQVPGDTLRSPPPSARPSPPRTPQTPSPTDSRSIRSARPRYRRRRRRRSYRPASAPQGDAP